MRRRVEQTSIKMNINKGKGKDKEKEKKINTTGTPNTTPSFSLKQNIPFSNKMIADTIKELMKKCKRHCKIQ